MAEEKFVSQISSADFDSALTGGLKYARGEFVSDAQKTALVDAIIEALPTYHGEVEDV